MTFSVLSACDNGPAAREAFVVRDSAGITIMENHDSAWTAGVAWRLVDEPSVEIGSESGDVPGHDLSYVMDVLRLPDGDIAVLDALSAQVRVFGMDGAFRYAFGGQGQGPGELRLPDRMALIHGDSIVVHDQGRFNQHVYSLAGEYGRTVAGPRMVWNGLSAVLPTGFLPDGSYLVASYPQSSDFPESPGVAEAEWHRFDNAGRHVRRLTRVPADHGRRLDPVGPYQVDGSTHLSPRISYAVVADGFWYAYPQSYEIRHFTTEGRVDRIVRRVWTPEAVPEGVKNDYRRWFREVNDPTDPSMPQAGRDRRRAEIEHLSIADTLPAFRTFVATRDGGLWVEPYPAADDLSPESWDRDGPPGRRRWSVFDADGRWLGNVVTPDRFSVHEIGRDYVLGVWRNELDVSFVRLYRIVKQG